VHTDRTDNQHRMGCLEATTEENCGTPRIPSADAA